MAFRELRLEFFKLITRKGNYLGFLAFMVLIALIYWGYRHGAHSYEMRKIGLDALSYVNGPFFAEMVMIPGMLLLIPIFVSLVAGDQIASEVQSGTLRVILSRPVSRARVILAKFLVTLLYTVVIVFFIGGLSLLIGCMVLGFGDLLVLQDLLGLGGKVNIIPQDEVLFRYFLAYSLGSWGAFTLASLGILLSVITRNANAATVSTISIYFVGHILTQIPLFSNIYPFLFTQHMLVWQKALLEIVPWVEIGRSCVCLGAFTLSFIGAALAIFTLKSWT